MITVVRRIWFFFALILSSMGILHCVLLIELWALRMILIIHLFFICWRWLLPVSWILFPINEYSKYKLKFVITLSVCQWGLKINTNIRLHTLIIIKLILFCSFIGEHWMKLIWKSVELAIKLSIFHYFMANDKNYHLVFMLLVAVNLYLTFFTSTLHVTQF